MHSMCKSICQRLVLCNITWWNRWNSEWPLSEKMHLSTNQLIALMVFYTPLLVRQISVHPIRIYIISLWDRLKEGFRGNTTIFPNECKETIFFARWNTMLCESIASFKIYSSNRPWALHRLVPVFPSSPAPFWRSEKLRHCRVSITVFESNMFVYRIYCRRTHEKWFLSDRFLDAIFLS